MVWRKILIFGFVVLLLTGITEAQIVDRIEEAGDVRVLKFIKPLVNYNGELVEPNPIFEPSDDPNYDYMIKRNYYEVYIKTNPIDVKTIYKNATVGFRNISLYVDVLQLLQLTNFNVSGNQARWDFYYEKTYTFPFIGSYTLYFNISFILTAYTNRLEKQLIIWDSSLPPEIVAILGSLLQYREQLYYYNTNFNPQTKEFDVGVRVEPARLFINSTNGFVEITAFDYTINESEFIVNVDYAQLDNLLQSGLSYPIIIDPTLTYDTSTTVCGDITDANGNLYDVIIVEEGVTLTVCSYTGAGTGYVNFTTTNTRLSRIEIYGVINADGSGYPGGAGGDCSNVAANCQRNGADGNGAGFGGGGLYSGAPASGSERSSGGGGAGFGGTGGDGGGDTGSVGAGGSTYTPTNFDLGSGGGGAAVSFGYTSTSGPCKGGDGGNGGGAIILHSPQIIIYNTNLYARGSSGEDGVLVTATNFYCSASGGGGGSGGMIKIVGGIVNLSATTFYVNGGNGGNGYRSTATVEMVGGGGGGGGGRIEVVYKDSLYKNNFLTSLSGGSAGTGDVSNGNPGNNGVYVETQDTNLDFVPPGSPKYSNPSSTVLSDKIKLNVVWNDTVGYSIDTVYAEVATSYNPLTNYTMTLVDPFISASENKGLYEYNYTFNNNEYGCFAWRSYANASDGIWNSTPYYYVYYKKVPTSYYSDWAKRKPVCILTYTNATDFQVKLNISYEVGMNQDYSDLRFTYFYTSNNSEVPIPYFIESYTNNYAIVWIKLPQVRDRYVETVLMYFNNTQATSESNPHRVFVWFDDFSNQTLSDRYVVFGGAFATLNTTTQTLELKPDTVNDPEGVYINITTPSNVYVRVKVREKFSAGGNQQFGVYARFVDENNFYVARIVDDDGSGTYLKDILKRVGGVYTQLTSGDSGVDPLTGWHVIEFKVYESSLEAVFTRPDNTKLTLTATDTSLASGYVGLFVGWASDTVFEFDDLIVMRSSPIEPKYSLLDVEVTNQPPYISTIFEPTDPSVYSPTANYVFKARVCDPDNNLPTTNDISNVILEFDGVNYTVSNKVVFNTTCLDYNITFNSLGAKTYNYTWYVNDSSNVWSQTTDSFTVNPYPATLDVLLNGTYYTTKWIQNNFYWNITAKANESTIPIQLITNYTTGNDTGTGFINKTIQISGNDADTFYFKVDLTDTQNYTATSKQILVKIDASPPVKISMGDLYGGSVNYNSLQQLHQFNITVTDLLSGVDVNGVIFEFGGINYTNINYVQINSTTYEFYISLTGIQPGIYTVKWYVPDSVDPNWLIANYTYKVYSQSGGGGGGGGGAPLPSIISVNNTFSITPRELAIIGVPNKERSVEIRVCSNYEKSLTISYEIIGVDKQVASFRYVKVGNQELPVGDVLILEPKSCVDIGILINVPERDISFEARFKDQFGNIEVSRIRVQTVSVLSQLIPVFDWLVRVLTWQIVISPTPMQISNSIYIKGNVTMSIPAGIILFTSTFLITYYNMSKEKRKYGLIVIVLTSFFVAFLVNTLIVSILT